MNIGLNKYDALAELSVGGFKQYSLDKYWQLNAARNRIQKKTGMKFSMRKTARRIKIYRTK